MTWFQVKLPEYSAEIVEATSERIALRKAIYRMFTQRPGKSLYYNDQEFSKEQAGILIDLLNQNGVHRYVVETIEVPALVGLTVSRAKERLEEVKLNLGKIKSRSLFEGVVVEQNPGYAYRVPINSFVEIVTDFKISYDLKNLADSLS